MPNIEDDYKKEVNIKKVVKAVKAIGEFALYSQSEDCNLLITRAFILNLTGEQFWEMQCALLAKRTGVWFFIAKEGLIEKDPVTDGEVDFYFQVVNNENAEIIGYTELTLNGVMLYAGEAKYIGIKSAWMDMLGGLSTVRKAPRSATVKVSDFHVLCIAKDPESQYLAPILF